MQLVFGAILFKWIENGPNDAINSYSATYVFYVIVE